MHYGKTMRKALSILLSAAMLFSSSSISPVYADEVPGGSSYVNPEDIVVADADVNAVTGSPVVLAASATVVTDPKAIQAGEVLQFEFGSKSGLDGFIVVDSSIHSEEKGYGLAAFSGKVGVGPKNADDALSDEDSALKNACLDLIRNPGELKFQVDVPNGVYNVFVYANDLRNGWGNEILYVNDVNIGTAQKNAGVTTIADMTFSASSVTTTGNAGLSIKGVGSQGYLNAVVIECVSLAQASNYTIKYDINGGIGTVPGDLSAVTTETAALNDGTGLTKEGYRFVGWAASATAKEGSLTYNYNDSDAQNSVVTLYAVWSKEYELVYNSNGGDTNVPTDTKKYIVGEEITLDTVTKPTKAGAVFLGWAGASNAESAVSKLTVTDANILNDKIQVYAVWQIEGAVNLKFDFGKTAIDGFIQITNQMYSADKGYGFTKSVTFMNDKGTTMGTSPAPIDESIYNMCTDYTYTTDAAGLEFQIDVPAGTYDVSVYAGLGGSGHTPTIKVNGKDLGTAATAKPNSENDLLKSTTVTVEADGCIIVSSTGSAGRNMINGIIVKTSENGAFPIPQNFKASSTSTSVELTWDAVADATHYTVFRHSPSGNDQYNDTYNTDFLQIGTTTDTSFTDPVLTDKEYEYYVIAVGSRDGETIEVSDPSEIVTNEIKGSTGMGNAEQ